MSQLLHNVCRPEKESKSQQVAFTHSSRRPAIPSTDCTLTGAEFAQEAAEGEQVPIFKPCWLKQLAYLLHLPQLL